MNKKQYIKPVVLFEEMEVTDCILRASNPTSTVTVFGGTEKFSDINPDYKNVTISGTAIIDKSGVGSKESDWSFDYSLDIDW